MINELSVNEIKECTVGEILKTIFILKCKIDYKTHFQQNK